MGSRFRPSTCGRTSRRHAIIWTWTGAGGSRSTRTTPAWAAAGTAFRDGYAWYRAGFGAPGAWSGRFVKLCFLGVSYAASVYVNGALVAEVQRRIRPVI
jgi:hypothetical protein